jgi:acyl-coenzyme A synthetase/AMP-(fatty) acid ligase
VNFARDVVDAAPADATALIELGRDGGRRVWSFAEVSRASAGLAGRLREEGVEAGDVVLTLVGNRSEWALALVACFRIGAVVLPCTEQLRAADLQARLETVRPRVVIADERNLGELDRTDARERAAVIVIPDPSIYAADPAPAVELDPEAPALIVFTSGTTGRPKAAVHPQRYLAGQELMARAWLGAEAGDVVWCTASSGWSKSARNAFVAPWLRGAAGVLHDARFDAAERLDVLARERVNVLCMSPTEYRLVAKRVPIRAPASLRRLVAAGEALDPETLERWREATGLAILDGYGQTETAHLTAPPGPGETRPGSMGRPLPGVRMWIDDGELVVDPASVPTFFTGYLGEPPASRSQPWRTGDRVRQDDDGYLYFDSRTDDVIISSGYRIGPFEVESVLQSHPAVAEAAVVGMPDPDRGEIVCAVVVAAPGYAPSDALGRELQDHVKRLTAPYKHPRVVEFVVALPRTASGKLRRAELRRRQMVRPLRSGDGR